MAQTEFIVGCATGFSGDRTDGVLPVVRSLVEGGGHALIFETLAERTLALAQLARDQDPDSGFEPLLPELLGPALGACMDHGIRIVGNFGAANPLGAARRIRSLAADLGLRAPRVAVLQGDQLATADQMAFLREAVGPRRFDALDVVSVNAYQGANEIAQALRAGAEVVVAGRVADPSLTVGPAMAHFGLEEDDWHMLGCATVAGHLLECGTQVSGGYFAIPGLKHVPGMDALGFPIAQLDARGGISLTKAANTGGIVDTRTVKEQLLYEVHDPAAYLTPDVVADLSQVRVAAAGADRVRVENAQGRPRPPTLKVNICHQGGWLAEAEISYAGVQAEARARLAAETVLKRIGRDMRLRVDIIGAVSILGDDGGRLLGARPPGWARDVRLRIAGAHPDRAVAQRVVREVTALYTCGPAGGGGVRSSVTRRLDILSTAIPRELAPASWFFLE